MRWATFETDEERPPLKVWSRAELDFLADGTYGVRRRTVRRANHLQPGETEDIARAYRAGADVEHLSQRFNRHPRTILKALRMEGVSI